MVVGVVVVGCQQELASQLPAKPPAALPERECWYSVSILGVKVGYQHSRIQPVQHQGRWLIRSETYSQLCVHRSGTPLVMEMRLSDLTTPEGVLVELSSQTTQAANTIRTEGQVFDDQLILKTTTEGLPQESVIPWKSNYGGFHAVELSLASAPMKLGQTRTLQALVPVVLQVAKIHLQAVQEEIVQLPGGEFRLLRIEATSQLPGGQTFQDTYWVDGTGLPLKVHSQVLNAELVATSPQLAQDPAGWEKLDLALDQAIPVQPRLVRPHQTSRVRYRVHLERGDPAKVFPNTPYQELRPLDPHTAELVVWASRPTLPAPKSTSAYEKPSAYDRKANIFIQSDHPRIVALAKEVVGQEKNVRQQALQLERFVHRYLKNKNFSTYFASALEVLQTREGDCTEHAVLLAALARAVGIPARVAIGLVYHDGKFYYHMWNELYVEDRWIGFDATLAEGGIGGAHILLAHSHLHGASAFAAFLPVLNVLGQGLRIELIDQQ
ncbi:MAG: transglutaminase domain-containing protein [Thermoguttaceae bacterium]|nr:transglutaminase domain-containing protein [Thermoguttaceae bacterium]MDW8037723.1 transglutaminase domain-containing protein [Thermoguttaceae bacterium]